MRGLILFSLALALPVSAVAKAKPLKTPPADAAAAVPAEPADAVGKEKGEQKPAGKKPAAKKDQPAPAARAVAAKGGGAMGGAVRAVEPAGSRDDIDGKVRRAAPLTEAPLKPPKDVPAFAEERP